MIIYISTELYIRVIIAIIAMNVIVVQRLSANAGIAAMTYSITLTISFFILIGDNWNDIISLSSIPKTLILLTLEIIESIVNDYEKNGKI